MNSRSKVLLLDDGDLSRIRQMLADFDVDLEHLRGDVIHEDLEGSHDVIIATVKRILALEGSVDLANLPNKPVWIAVHSQDFLPLRVRLHKLGVSFLIQSSVGSEALRLLLAHAVYRGAEKREELRLPVGMQVDGRDAAGNSFAAELLDLAHDGCRLLSDHALQPESMLSVHLPSKLASGEDLSLPGRILRVEDYHGSERNMVTVVFEEITPAALELLDAILEGKVIGTVVTRLGDDLSEKTASTTIPGRAALEPDRESAAPQSPPPHERRTRRVVYTRKVTALLGGGEYVILGRDLSIAGMRSEPVPEWPVGMRLELAIYGPAGAEPVLVQAVVSRDDGPLGTVFHFESMEPGGAQLLEKIIAAKPEIQWLSDGGVDERIVVSRTRVRPGRR